MSTNDDFDLLEWIETGTIGRREVTIYNDPALAVEMERLTAEYDTAQRESGAEDERTMGDISRLAELEQQMEAIYERWQASKAVWTIQALEMDFVRDLMKEMPNPPAPKKPAEPKPSPNPGKAAEQRKAYEAAVAEYEPRRDAWLAEIDRMQKERNLHLLSEAIVEVRTPKGSTSSVSIDALRAMRAKPHGEARLEKLTKAMDELTTGEVEIPAPHRD